MFYAEGGETLAEAAWGVVGAPSLATFKVRLAGARGNPLWWEMSLLAPGVGRGDP